MRTCIAMMSVVFTLAGLGPTLAREIPMADTLARASEIEGKSVTIKNCSIVHAARDFLACGTPGTEAISVLVDSPTLKYADRQAALKNCASANMSARCETDVAGVAKRVGSHVILTEADIFWKHAAEQRPTYDAVAAVGQALPRDLHVAINNCMISGANNEYLSCVGQNQAAGPHVLIFLENLPAADGRRARKLCSGWNDSQACAADITGKLTAFGSSYYRLDHPGIFWKEENVALD